MDQDLIKSLFEDILGKVCAVLLKQFTKDVISALQIEKKMEHRKQIKVIGKNVNQWIQYHRIHNHQLLELNQ